ncbi:MAG: tandem-95 repeat protein, partial [Methylococcales bacterium]|nr:tandem-95 repeat protein [Methylococcales bacterium]
MSNSSFTTTEATAITGTLQASDIDNNSLTYTLLTTGTKGTAALTSAATGTFSYTPAAGQIGQDSFTFNVSDGATTSTTGTVNILINPKPNRVPVASDSSVTTIESTVVNGTLQASDADADPLTYSLVSNGTKGAVTITNVSSGTFSYTPDVGQTGQDTFTFNVSDGTDTSATATVNVTITPAAPKPNAAPIANNSVISTIESTSVNGLLQASDADNDPLTYSLVSNGAKGTAVITNAATGAFTYTPITGQTGSDSFVFNVSDSRDISGNATVSVTINADIKRGVEVSPVSYLSGQVELGTQTRPKNFTVKNTGSESIDISSIEVIGSHASEFTRGDENCINQP